MKKTLTINLAGLVYYIDEDAYIKLNNYLSALQKKFKNEADLNDIISDIEARIAELLTERLGNKKQVVTLEDVQYTIEIMGDPDTISDEESSFEPEPKLSSKKAYRRIYRDPDNRILGGVCSGLGAYWNIDAVIIRIIFIVLVLLVGSGIFIYLVLWFIIPEAQTTAQKLEMRGEAVTVDSIKDFIKEEFENVKKSFKGNKNK